MWHALLQDVELMPQYQDFGFQSPSRLEAIAQSPVTASQMDWVFGSDTGPPATSSLKTPTTSRPVYQASVSRLVRPSTVIGPSVNW